MISVARSPRIRMTARVVATVLGLIILIAAGFAVYIMFTEPALRMQAATMFGLSTRLDTILQFAERPTGFSLNPCFIKPEARAELNRVIVHGKATSSHLDDGWELTDGERQIEVAFVPTRDHTAPPPGTSVRVHGWIVCGQNGLTRQLTVAVGQERWQTQ